VKGLQGETCEIFRKSGTWQKYHADAALVEHGGRSTLPWRLWKTSMARKYFRSLFRSWTA
jgi:hypothetical protein